MEIINAVLSLGTATRQNPREDMKRLRQNALNASYMQRVERKENMYQRS
jgi:hypothetical protein